MAAYRDRPLQPMQMAFRNAYLAQPFDDKDPERAAVEAGYSKKTAAEQGRRLLLHPKIREELLIEHPARARELADIDAAWVLHELANLWTIPLDTLFDSHGHLRAIHDIPAQAQKLIAGFEVTQVTTWERGKNGKASEKTTTTTGKVKLHDRLRVLEDLGKLTKVNAFGTANISDAADSITELMRAASKQIADPKTHREVELTEVKEIEDAQDQ